ncbi:DNA excision repair protein ERCC-6 [Holothuria leucospilota]|uniref:DNA excision repair protein ERCC-6 n=1 Tax=Holothuria leucospilota TaxID=206669 RepID=A0A9Q1C3V4_HOLLE|nr:DNA excision repair protein ERCC-6 [Holothuria leucospilota]
MASNSGSDSLELTTNSKPRSDCETKSGDITEQGYNGSAKLTGKDESEVVESSEGKLKKKNVFEIDRNKIKMIPGSASQVGELQNLGVDVISQEDFEKGVLDQVDKAISLEEEKAAKDRAQRDLDAIQTDIRLATRDLNKIEKILVTMKKQGIQRNISDVNKQKEEKEKELKSLNKKRKSLMNQLEGKPDEEEDSGDEDDAEQNTQGSVLHHLLTKPLDQKRHETEQERMIRMGEVTPFEVARQSAKENRGGMSSMDSQSDFALFLGAKDVQTVKKHMEKSKWKGAQRQPEIKTQVRVAGTGWRSVEDTEALKKKDEEKQKRKKEKRKTPKMKFEPKYDPTKGRNFKTVKVSNKKAKKNLRHNWGSDAEISDHEEERGHDSDGSNFSDEIPSHALEESSEDEIVLPPTSKKEKKKSKAEQIEDGDITCLDDLKASYGVKVKTSFGDRVPKCTDDATQDLYFKRLKANRRAKEKRRQQRRDAGEDGDEDEESDSDLEDAELKGGLIIPGKIWHKLYRYQMTGVRWMWELHQQRAGGIMGDEMGLGKTIQMIAFLAGLKHSHLRDPDFRYSGLGPVLIICPATVMHQWVREFHKWYPDFRVAILHTSGSFMGSKATLVRDIVNSHGILVTSYTTCRIQQELLHKFEWHYVVLDEGHKIRNPDAESTIACKQFRTPHRLILTGSPLQNNLQELWSLFDFVFPGKLGTLPVFLEQFSVPITQGGYANATSVQVQTAYKCACVLRDTINPYLLRRMKADVQQNVQLPSKNEQVLFCRLTDEQKEIYKDYLNSRECHLIMKGDYQIFSGLITMRKICNHPHLVTGGPPLLKGQDEESIPVEERYGHWSKAGKMIVIDSLLKIWKKQGHRVLLFTQGKQMLDIIESYIKVRYTYLRLDGSTGISSRQSLINQFNQNSSIFVFILTTRVGGLGVNLTGANRVIIYDPDWNPSTDSQARERAWRIGQKRDVTIYRLLTAGTIEEKIYHRQIYKHFLTNRVLKDPRQRRFFKSNDLFELFTLNDGTEDTETSAIFAGTGSNIKANNDQEKTQSTPKKLKSKGMKSQRSWRGEGKDLDALKRSKSDADMTRKDILAPKRTASADNLHPEEIKFSIPKKIPRKDEENEGTKVFDFNKIIPEDDEDEMTAGQSEMKKDEEKKHRSKDEGRKKRKDELSSPLTKKKKKRRKDAKLDGVRISNLAKHRIFKSAKDQEVTEQEEKEAHKKQDEFVLEKLFKKSGVHSALKHDNIMEASNPDYVLIENEASRVAREAARALKESRQTCPNARSGVPTWTGTFGQGGSGTSRPRFGQSVNSNLASPVATQNSSSTEGKDEDKGLLGHTKLFGGDEAIKITSSQQQGSALPSSSLLLAKMRARNQVQMTEDQDEGSSSKMVPMIPKKYENLVNELKVFITEQAQIPGQASTDEILKNFQKKLNAEDTPVFRSMLRQVCKFERDIRGKGTWRMRIEYL